MEKEFIPYKLALKLKELGFNEKCFANWIDKDKRDGGGISLEMWDDEITEYIPINEILAPIWQQAFNWFREKYGLESSSPMKKNKDLEDFYGGFIIKSNKNFGESYGSNFKTYEEANIARLEKLIKIVENGRTIN